jgi:hypothetical protein
MLAEASLEQKIIINAIKTNNVKVNSVSGSGKTTTVLHMAKELHKESILLLTYNARLKLETRKRKNELGLNNLSVDSYHSFCVGNYNRKCFKDSVIIKILEENSKPSDSQILFRLPATKDISKFVMNDVWKYTPTPGTVVVFPSHLPHTVYPWKGIGHRTVMAFDAILVPKEQQ